MITAIILGFFTILLTLLLLYSIGYLCEVFVDFFDDFRFEEFKKGKFNYIKTTLKGNFEFIKYINRDEPISRIGIALVGILIIVGVFGGCWAVGTIIQAAFI